MNKKSQQTVLLAVGIFYLGFALIIYLRFALIVYWFFALFICANSVSGKCIVYAADGSGLYAHVARAVC